MINVFASNEVDLGFECQSDQTKDYKTDTFFVSPLSTLH